LDHAESVVPACPPTVGAAEARAVTRRRATAARDAGVRPSLRIAYLTTEYPKVSHTFIRREIRALEARGVEVLRLAIRRGPMVDAADRDEAARTFACLGAPRLPLLRAAAATALGRPLRLLQGLGAALRMNRASDRGALRHLAYLCEAAALLRACESAGIDHVHVHFGTNAASVAQLVRRLSGGRVTFSMTVHGPDEFDAPRALGLCEKVADAAFVVAISDFCSAQLRRWSRPVDWHKLHVVRCAVDDAFFAASCPVPPQSRLLLSIGRLSAQKGQLLLLEAMQRLCADGTDARLLLVGDGELRTDVECAIRARGLERHVAVTGWVCEQELLRLLASARALVQPSFAEGLPVVLMEAMAMGRPVVATHVAGIPELVVAGESGWLVPAGNVGELVAAMRALLAAAPAQLAAMGRAAAQRVRERHHAATAAARLEHLFARRNMRDEGGR